MTLQPAQKLAFLREFADLEKRRTTVGVTPLDYMRWLDLMQQLDADKPPAAQQAADDERRAHPRSPTRMQIEFKTPVHFRRGRLSNFSRGGVFVNTPFAPDVGTELVVLMHIESENLTLEVPATVVSNNIGDGLSTTALGMGLRFGPVPKNVAEQLDVLYDAALEASS